MRCILEDSPTLTIIQAGRHSFTGTKQLCNNPPKPMTSRPTGEVVPSSYPSTLNHSLLASVPWAYFCHESRNVFSKRKGKGRENKWMFIGLSLVKTFFSYFKTYISQRQAALLDAGNMPTRRRRYLKKNLRKK